MKNYREIERCCAKCEHCYWDGPVPICLLVEFKKAIEGHGICDNFEKE